MSAPGAPPPSSRGSKALSESAHPRTFRENRFVYPVLSRRAGGVSVGVNLNPDKACNFDCIYCQVDRSKKPQEFFVDLPELVRELRETLAGLKPGGALWIEPEFAGLPAEKRRLSDVAFSGDGEPTTFRNFSEVVRACVGAKEDMGLKEPQVRLITNATGLDRPDVREALEFLDGHQGEVWAKLDAGTPGYFKLIDNTDFPFEKVLANIATCARERSIVIQSLFLRVRGAGPTDAEIDAFVERLREVLRAGGRIHLVQIYTVARPPAYGIVSSLPAREVDRIAARVAAETGLNAPAYYGEVAEGAGLIRKEPEGGV